MNKINSHLATKASKPNKRKSFNSSKIVENILKTSRKRGQNSQSLNKDVNIAKFKNRHEDYFKLLSMQRMKGVNFRINLKITHFSYIKEE